MRTVLMTGAVSAIMLVGCGRNDAPTQRAAVEAQAPDRHADARRRDATAQPRSDPRGGGMPWNECRVEDERLRFVARLLGGDKMAALNPHSRLSLAQPCGVLY